jgi:hypothetical protein
MNAELREALSQAFLCDHERIRARFWREFEEAKALIESWEAGE